MATIWKFATKANTNNTFSGTTLSSWSRQQKIATIASFVMLGFLLAFARLETVAETGSGQRLQPGFDSSRNHRLNARCHHGGNLGPARGTEEGAKEAACDRDLQRSKFRCLVPLSAQLPIRGRRQSAAPV